MKPSTSIRMNWYFAYRAARSGYGVLYFRLKPELYYLYKLALGIRIGGDT